MSTLQITEAPAPTNTFASPVVRIPDADWDEILLNGAEIDGVHFLFVVQHHPQKGQSSLTLFNMDTPQGVESITRLRDYLTGELNDALLRRNAKPENAGGSIPF